MNEIVDWAHKTGIMFSRNRNRNVQHVLFFKKKKKKKKERPRRHGTPS